MKKLFIVLFFLLAHTLVINAQDSTPANPATLHHMQVRELDLYKKNVDDKVAAQDKLIEHHGKRLEDEQKSVSKTIDILILMVAILTLLVAIFGLYAGFSIKSNSDKVKKLEEDFEEKLKYFTKEGETHIETIKEQVSEGSNLLKGFAAQVQQSQRTGEEISPQMQEEIKEELEKGNTPTAESYFLQGYLAQEKGEHQKACKYYENATKLNPNDAIAYNNWGYALADLEDYKGAIEKYKKAIEIDQKNASPYNNWGFALGNLKDYKGAIGKYKKAIEINPKNAYAYNNWGDALGDLEDYKEAIKKYKKAIEINPNLAEAYNNWGDALGNLEDYKGAIEKYKKAIEKNPNLAEAYNNWGSALGNLKDYKGAIEKYKKAIEIKPNLAEAYYGWGDALADLKDYKGAIEKYKKAIEIKPKYASAYNNWAYTLNLFNTPEAFEEAIIHAKKAMELNSKMPNAPKNLGNAYLGLKRYGEAIDSYYAAIDLKGDHLEANTNCDTALDGLEKADPDLYPAKVEEFKKRLQKNKDLPALKDNEEFIRIYKKYCKGS